MFNVLCLDQSTAKIGWAIFRNAKLYKYGFLDIEQYYPDKDIFAHANRRQVLMNLLSDLLKKEKIHYILYEGIFNKQNIDTVIKLAKIQGLIEDISLSNKLEFEQMDVNTWRSYLPLKAKSKKRDDMKKAVCEYVISLYPHLKNEMEDTLEAIGIGEGWIKMQEKFMS